MFYKPQVGSDEVLKKSYVPEQASETGIFRKRKESISSLFRLFLLKAHLCSFREIYSARCAFLKKGKHGFDEVGTWWTSGKSSIGSIPV